MDSQEGMGTGFAARREGGFSNRRSQRKHTGSVRATASGGGTVPDRSG